MKRILLYSTITVLAVRLVWLFLIPAWSGVGPDFQNYYTPSWAIHQGSSVVDLYDPLWFETEKELCGIHGEPNPASFTSDAPFSALWMWPVAGFPPLTAKRIWMIVDAAALVLLITMVVRATSVPASIVILIALLGGDALGSNFISGQFTLLLALLVTAGVYFKDRVPWLAGLSVALATVTAIFPGFLMAYFVVTRRWRVLAWSVAGASLLTLFSVAVMGWLPHRVFVTEVLPRILRGEIQDPYNVHWNTLQALLRRALMFEPGLNPRPIAEAPALYFFLQAAAPLAVVFITLVTLRQSSEETCNVSPLVEFGALVTAILLISPNQGNHLQFLVFPAIVAAMHYFKDLRVQIALAGVFALICMSATIPAFPRVYSGTLLWVVFLGILGLRRVSRRTLLMGLGIAMVFAGLSAAREMDRWAEDLHDGAIMVHPDPAGLLETFPTVGASGLSYASMKPSSTVHPSAFGKGLIYELHGTVYGRLADGHGFGWAGAAEPSLGPSSVVAIRQDARGWAIVERSGQDSGWREIFRSLSVLHDPTLAPDDSRIAFSQWIDGHYQIVEWNRQTQSAHPLVSGSGDYRYPAYAPSGRWLFYSENASGQWDIVRLSLQDGLREILTTSEANDFMPAISSDEHTLYFASDRRRGYRFTAIYQLGLR